MPDFFGDGNTPRRSDPSWVVLQKILGALTGSGGSTIGVQQVYYNRNPTAPINPAYDAISFDANGVITNWVGGGSTWT